MANVFSRLKFNLIDKSRFKLIDEKIKLEIEKKHQSGEFSLYETSFFRDRASTIKGAKSYEYLYNLVKAHDSEYNIPLEVGKELESLLSTSKNYLGIYFIDNKDDEIKHVINEGVNFQIGNYKTTRSNYGLSLSPSVIPFHDLTGYVNLLDKCNNGKIGFIVEFSKDIFDRDLKLQDSYKLDDLKSEYSISPLSIFKAIALNSDGKCTLYNKEAILNERDGR